MSRAWSMPGETGVRRRAAARPARAPPPRIRQVGRARGGRKEGWVRGAGPPPGPAPARCGPAPRRPKRRERRTKVAEPQGGGERRLRPPRPGARRETADQQGVGAAVLAQLVGERRERQ